MSPTVLHVSARTVSKHALSIYNDHSDVMGCRQTGFAMLCAGSVQETLDFAIASHITTVKSKIPFLHFFDGNRTSAEIKVVHRVPYEDMLSIYPTDLLHENLRKNSLNPNHPILRGGGVRPDTFFQGLVGNLQYHNAVPKHLDDTFDAL